jgi:hypothetical protein
VLVHEDGCRWILTPQVKVMSYLNAMLDWCNVASS